MAKVYMMCAPVCCGKTTEAAKLRAEKKAVVLSVDDITLALFGQNAGKTPILSTTDFLRNSARFFKSHTKTKAT